MSLELKQKKVIYIIQGLESSGSEAKSDPLSVFVNKVLLNAAMPAYLQAALAVFMSEHQS